MTLHGLNSPMDASAASDPKSGQRQKLDVQRWQQEMERFVEEVSTELTSIAEMVDAIEDAPSHCQALPQVAESMVELGPNPMPEKRDMDDMVEPDADLHRNTLPQISTESQESDSVRDCETTSDVPVVPDCVPGNRLRSIQERLQSLGSSETRPTSLAKGRDCEND